eukprot:TRINITY_DN3476_c0_g1_i1.p4 TRINITY_DN3476_c0_g1~~TRINITY_DN3476_c0_g1_i1.p4  ORF type:complete len:103 (+),score=6.07 TRINITY_DN3476_c0_g1_i1:721-1029(+)
MRHRRRRGREDAAAALPAQYTPPPSSYTGIAQLMPSVCAQRAAWADTRRLAHAVVPHGDPGNAAARTSQRSSDDPRGCGLRAAGRMRCELPQDAGRRLGKTA